MTYEERGYAILDAIERIEELFEKKKEMKHEEKDDRHEFDGSVDVDDLRKQAKFWFDEAKLSYQEKNGTTAHSSANSGIIEEYKENNTPNSKSLTFKTDSTTRMASTTSDEKVSDRSERNQELQNNFVNIPSSCMGDCQFNTDFWGGQVCSNCFRDSFEVQNWHKFTNIEREVAFMDTIERMKNSKSFPIKFDWKEYDIATQEEHIVVSSSKFREFIEGDRVIKMDSVVQPIICEQIIERVRINAYEHLLEREANGLINEGLVRLPIIDASRRAKESNTACAKSINEETDEMLKEIFKRVLNCLDSQFIPLVESMFGTKSLYGLYQEDNLIYSSREPAINVYTKGGKFLAHKDGQQLTVLIPLSSPHEFDGGGTAFWSHQSRGHRVDPPSLILNPNGGSALIFGGNVTHAGLPVEWGERVVFVASFSKRRLQVNE